MKSHMNLRTISLALTICLLLCGFSLFAASCTGAPVPTPADDGKTIIVCTGFAGLDFTRSLLANYKEQGGEGMVELTLLGKPGQDMHDFEPSAADIITLSTADVVVCTGAETWLPAALSSAGNKGVRLVSMMDICDTIEEHDHEHHDHAEEACGLIGQDEHVWLSVENAKIIVKEISTALSEADADNAAAWRVCTEIYLAELTALRADFAAMIRETQHDCVVVADRYPFAYLFRELGISAEAAFPGCSSETSASFATQTRLVEATRELGLAYIFAIDGSDATVAKTVAEQTGTEVLLLDSLQVVTDMDKTYVTVMRGNLENLKKALQ